MPAASQSQTTTTSARKIRHAVFTAPIAVLGGLAVLAIALFLVTTLYSRAYRRMQVANARHWFERGQSELQAGHPRVAADAFRNALSFHRDREYLFRLSQALVAAGEYEEARGYLLNLWDQQPGRGELNLALARLDATTGRPEDALRHYQNAIYGVWDSNPDVQRRQVRFELADFLLARGDRSNAEADLIALSSNLPQAADTSVRVAKLFAAAGDIDRSLQFYKEAAKLAPSSVDALAGAGNAAFELGDYALARQYLARAAILSPSDKTLAQNSRIAEAVLTMDPLQRGLSAPERARRTVAAWKQAISTIGSCARQRGLDLAQNTGPQSTLLSAYSDLAALKPDMHARTLEDGGDVIETTLNRISAAESATAATCGTLSPSDVALQLIAKSHGISQQ